MSETPAVDAPAEVPFTPVQVEQFDRDDAEAGAAIGKMLSMFFLYTVIVMSISTVVTYWWISQARGS